MNYRLTVSYDGTRYLGWQKLGEPGSRDYGRTIQGKLEAILTGMTGAPVEVIGSGRTDAGVHALGQVANFHTDYKACPEDVQAYLNRYLPEDIAVTEVREVPERFHARYNARAKTYRYCIRNSAVPDVFSHQYEYHITEPLDIDKMRRCAALLCGLHDYKSFTKRTKKSTVRTVYSIHIVQESERLEVLFRGDGFLYNMVRILMGTLLECGLGQRDPERVPELFEGEDRRPAGYTVPAMGLTLMHVEY